MKISNSLVSFLFTLWIQRVSEAFFCLFVCFLWWKKLLVKVLYIPDRSNKGRNYFQKTFGGNVADIHPCWHAFCIPAHSRAPFPPRKKLICVSQMYASPNQSGPAHGNLSPLRMSLFAIFSQLRPNIPDHTSAQGRRAATGAHGSITHIIAWRYLLREAAMCVFQIGDEKTLD